MTYIGHFYFCTVLDALVSGKFILAVLDGTTAPSSRSAIANGSACTITIIASVMLGTAGGLDLCFAANDHFAGAICAAADAGAAAVCSIFCRYLSIASMVTLALLFLLLLPTPPPITAPVPKPLPLSLSLFSAFAFTTALSEMVISAVSP